MYRPNWHPARYAAAGLLAAGLAAALVAVGGLTAAEWKAASASQYQYPPKKVVICHRTGSRRRPFVTISVAQSAVRAHLRHGDTLGPCSRRLNGTVTPFRISFTNTRGQRVAKLRRGTFTVFVSDRARSQNFHLLGKRVNRKTSLRFRGVARWRVTFVRGVYTYGSDGRRGLRGKFRVR